MNPTLVLVAVLAFVAGGAALYYGVLRNRLSEARDRAEAAERARAEERERAARLQASLEAREEELSALKANEERLRTSFEAVAAQALRESGKSFLELAREQFKAFQTSANADLEARKAAVENLVKPVETTLRRFEDKIGAVEKQRVEGFAGLGEQIRELTRSNAQLHDAAHGLRRALSTPSVRGQWGELTLRRLVEMAGMSEHCDFLEQETVQGAGGQLRPDLLVLLPGGRRIAVDSKVPLDHFLKAMDAEDERAQKPHLRAHADAVRGHVKTLSQRSYQDSIGDSPDFVVLHLSDAAYSAAVQARPEIVEEAIREKVVLATPMLLIGLLKTIEHAWRQERLADNAEEIRRLGRELYERMAILGEHFERVGRGLGQAVGAYNRAVGSFETRLLATGRKFDELGIASGKSLPELEPVDERPRSLSAPDFAAPDGSDHDGG
ncbi:MAG: DNA recombination protein RmuC [Longimicrobiales bacterium]|nr:DNA recombination protein RmuC [Longimicrobiales bacterium]